MPFTEQHTQELKLMLQIKLPSLPARSVTSPGQLPENFLQASTNQVMFECLFQVVQELHLLLYLKSIYNLGDSM